MWNMRCKGRAIGAVDTGIYRRRWEFSSQRPRSSSATCSVPREFVRTRKGRDHQEQWSIAKVFDAHRCDDGGLSVSGNASARVREE